MIPEIRFVKTHPDAVLPTRATEQSAGLDVYAVGNYKFSPGERKLVNTGLKIGIHDGYELQVRPRSGLALKKGLTVLNSPGTVDADYRGPLGVVLINHSADIQWINPGDRIAQLVLAEVELNVTTRFVDSFEATERGEGGFGSTGS